MTKKMDSRYLEEEMIESYRNYLIEDEKSKNTIEKYIRDIGTFYRYFQDDRNVTKMRVIQYKTHLENHYAISSVNSMLVAVNSFFSYLGWDEMRIKLIRRQRKIYCPEECELNREEYKRLIEAAEKKGKCRLSMVMKTVCATGIRISELCYITVEAVKTKRAQITLKGKTRIIFLPGKLCGQLLDYARKNKITSGYIFQTKNGNPLDRSNIWHEMKKICQEAGVSDTKVFPHNLRHLFARTYYEAKKDIVRLADILGHSSVETTRIYTISSGVEQAKEIEMLQLVI